MTVCDDDSEEGLIPFPSDERRLHDVAPCIKTFSVVLFPVVTDDGPVRDAVAAGVIVTTASASSPAPHDVVARPE